MILQNFSKIITTIGPSSNNEKTLQQFIELGIRIFRLNFSHGTHDNHEKTIHLIRALESKYNIPLTIIADLQGPKIRIGEMIEPLHVNTGHILNIKIGERQKEENTIVLPYKSVFKSLQLNNHLLIDDGKIKIKIIKVSSNNITAKVLNTGIIQSNKSFTVPNIHLDIPVFTQKDEDDLKFAVSHQCDWIAMSFVQTATDITQLHEKIKTLSSDTERPSVIAKLERPIAVNENLNEILKVSDAVMVARGDLGVELPLEQIPLLQKSIVKSANQSGKPVIVATQMLESMLQSSVPSRADITDIANAILDGADCVMLSAESAVSKQPVHIVKTMRRIIQTMEQSKLYKQSMKNIQNLTMNFGDAISYACSKIVKHYPIELIITLTTTGETTKQITHYRPFVTILSVSPRWRTARKMNLLWGCFPIKGDPEKFINSHDDIKEYGKIIVSNLKKQIPSNASIILTAGYPLGVAGSTNLLRIFKMPKKTS